MIIKNYEGETKEFSELLDKLEKKYMCNRYYCYFCLKGSYDTLAENIKDNNAWLCPYCTGACYCTRCMRNEKILQLIAYYFSINGDINYLYNELISMNSILDELFSNLVISNIYLIIYDKNLTPAQMVNNFINYDINKLNDIQNKIQNNEDKIQNLKEYIQTLNKQKEEIHKEFSNFCKDKYEIKHKFNLINGNNLNYMFNEESDLINNDYSNNEKEEIKEKKIKLHNENIKEKEKEENYFKFKNDEEDINKSNIEMEEDKKEGIQTRKKKKVSYFKDKYYSRKKEKKILRKNEDKLLTKSNKYYIKNN